MVEAARTKRWTKDEFFAWLDEGHGGENRWELVDGAPRMMTNPVVEHGIVVGNLAGMLRDRLRGGPCRPFTGDYSIETTDDQLRLPDVLVDCGERRRGERVSRGPTVAIEVLSPSTRGIDSHEKLEEFRGVASLAHIVIVEPNRPDIAVWTREGGDWSYARITDPAGTLALPAIGADLPLAEIYEDVPLA